MSRDERALAVWGATHAADVFIRGQGVKYRWAWWQVELFKLFATLLIVKVAEAI